VSVDELGRFIDGIAVGDAVKERLRALKVTEYVGLATRVCDAVVAEARKEQEP
jgi:hypothetical protein